MNTIKKLNYLLSKKYKIYTLLILFVIIMGSMAELLGISIILPIVNLAIDPEEIQNNIFCRVITKVTGADGLNEVLLILIVLTICIYIAKSAYLIWMNFAINRYSMSVRSNIAMKLLSTYMKQPYTYFLRKNTSEIVRSINIDTTHFHSMIGNMLYAVSYGLTSICIILYLCKTNIQMTMMVAALLTLCALSVLGIIQKKVKFLGKENQRLQAEMIKYVEESFSGIKEVKVMNREKFFVDICKKVYDEQAEVNRKATLYNVTPKYMIEAIAIVGILLFMSINIVVNDNFVSLVPQLSVFAVAAMRLLPSANAFYAYINAAAYDKASVDLVYKDVKESEGLENGWQECDSVKRLALKKDIWIKNVSFSYDKESPVLENVDFKILSGNSVALVGPSGGGKTTLADIILGVLEPQQGQVLVDGADIAETVRAWHESIGYIPQMIFLLDDSIKRNVAFGLKEDQIDEEKVKNALQKAQLWEFVDGLKEGMDTIVGERGTRLSGGQRQRIGIARALYTDPSVLVFDEATSALDNNTEKEVMQAIDGLHGEKTILMIAHRLSTIENCDHIYKIENHKLEMVR